MGEFQKRIMKEIEDAEKGWKMVHIKTLKWFLTLLKEAEKEFPCRKLDKCRESPNSLGFPERRYCHQCDEPLKWFKKWLKCLEE